MGGLTRSVIIKNKRVVRLGEEETSSEALKRRMAGRAELASSLGKVKYINYVKIVDVLD
jgi:hypothetical protein